MHRVLATLISCLTVMACEVKPDNNAAATPDPPEVGKVCEHVKQLWKKGVPEGSDPELAEKVHEGTRKACVADLMRVQQEDPKGYARRAECYMASESLEAMESCRE